MTAARLIVERPVHNPGCRAQAGQLNEFQKVRLFGTGNDWNF